jgi:hypothetical protein
VHAGTAEPLRVSPPEAVAYLLELIQAESADVIKQKLRCNQVITPTVRKRLLCVSVSALHWRASLEAACPYGKDAERQRAGWLCTSDHKPTQCGQYAQGRGHGRAMLAFPLAERARAEVRGRAGGEVPHPLPRWRLDNNREHQGSFACQRFSRCLWWTPGRLYA